MTDNDQVKQFKYVDYLWDEKVAKNMSLVERLVYRSNLIGSDQRVTNTGGGNTSCKTTEKDPITGEEVDVIWIKGSGGDLRTARKENFASIELKKLFELRDKYNNSAGKGLKTKVEDQTMQLQPHCTYNRNPRPGSIETPTHGFQAAKFVDHTHPNSAIAVAASRNSKKLTEEIYGGEIGWVQWMRPGFELAIEMHRVAQANPELKGLIMSQHGIINWADDDKLCYERTLTFAEKASAYIESKDKGAQTFGGAKYQTLEKEKSNELLVELLPWLRGKISQNKRMIGTVQSDSAMLRFANSHDAKRLAELGTSCPDHFIRTKIKPLYVDWDPQNEKMDSLKEKLDAGLVQYRQDYTNYYETCKREDSPAMRDPNPTVILIPGVGMIAWGKNKSESRVTAEFYGCAVEVMRGAEAIDEYIALPKQEAFDIEYWSLEEAKLQRMPPEKHLARKIVLVVGAGSGIGKATALRLAEEGAHVICADLNEQAAQETVNQLIEIHGQGIGVAGTDISGCGLAIACAVDVTDRNSIQEMFNKTILAYGGIDHIVMTAGMFVAPEKQKQLDTKMWAKVFDVNVSGPYNLFSASKDIFDTQNLEGSVVLATSVNGAVAKKGSFAYDSSKAAANHLVRELAMEMAPLVRVNGIAPATVIKNSTMFSKERVIASLTKYSIDFDKNESGDDLRDKLARFYAQRSLLEAPITPEDQAQAAYFLISDCSSKTTGQIVNVDGGLHEAFLR